MYIKLIRLDGSPIWLNSSFIVTIEPRKGGGSIVVPIGDGLDYDVRESPEKVLAMLDGAPEPVVVPVPAPKGLAPTAAADVSPDDFTAIDSTPVKEEAPTESESVPEATDDVFASAVQPADPPSPPASVLPADAPSSAASDEKKPARTRAKKTRTTTRKTKKPELDLTEDQIARLKKLAPGSVRKLQNTLTAQFGSTEPDATIAALEAHEHFLIDRDHIIWK